MEEGTGIILSEYDSMSLYAYVGQVVPQKKKQKKELLHLAKNEKKKTRRDFSSGKNSEKSPSLFQNRIIGCGL